VHFGLGATIAVSRESLVAIGGFETIADYLADDYELVRHIHRAGFRAELASVVVETSLPKYGLWDFLQHQARWARTVRAVRPSGYVSIALTFGVFWAAVLAAVSRGAWWAWMMFALTFGVRWIVAANYGRLLGDAKLLDREWYLIPLRDLMTPFLWMMGFSGRRVVWRGEVFELKQGKLKKTSSRSL
jgi:ceramide glucosyltransferase